jgi:uncharacterized protein with FMN-binding domain
MRRAPIVLSATVVGFGGALAFKPHKPELSTAIAAAGTPAPQPSTSATATPTATATASSSKSGKQTADGDAIPTQYGNAQVRVTITDGKITDVQPLQLQSNEPKSVAISSYAAPYLRQSALAKQSAAIDVVSGATVTSMSYEASLQSALDKLGFKAPDGSRGSTEVPQIEDEHGGWGR